MNINSGWYSLDIIIFSLPKVSERKKHKKSCEYSPELFVEPNNLVVS